MKNQYCCLFLLAALSHISCGSNKSTSDPHPTNSIPSNSASLKIDGVDVAVDLSKTAVNVYSQTGMLAVVIGTFDSRAQVVRLTLLEYNGKPGKITAYSPNSNSGIQLANASASFNTFDTFNCPTVDRTFEVVEVNQDKKTLSLKFAGKVCGLNGTDQRVVSEGQLNLPYRTI